MDKIGVFFQEQRETSVRFNAIKKNQWDLWDLCEPKGARAAVNPL